jgi:hypothetical protein
MRDDAESAGDLEGATAGMVFERRLRSLRIKWRLSEQRLRQIEAGIDEVPGRMRDIGWPDTAWILPLRRDAGAFSLDCRPSGLEQAVRRQRIKRAVYPRTLRIGLRKQGSDLKISSVRLQLLPHQDHRRLLHVQNAFEELADGLVLGNRNGSGAKLQAARENQFTILDLTRNLIPAERCFDSIGVG